MLYSTPINIQRCLIFERVTMVAMFDSKCMHTNTYFKHNYFRFSVKRKQKKTILVNLSLFFLYDASVTAFGAEINRRHGTTDY